VELATWVDAIDWSPQGEWVALAMGDGAVRRWQPGADRVQDWLEHDAGRGLRTSYGLETSPVCWQLAVMCAPGSSVFLWDLAGLRAQLETLGMSW
jgi:hypothetical protein